MGQYRHVQCRYTCTVPTLRNQCRIITGKKLDIQCRNASTLTARCRRQFASIGSASERHWLSNAGVPIHYRCSFCMDLPVLVINLNALAKSVHLPMRLPTPLRHWACRNNSTNMTQNRHCCVSWVAISQKLLVLEIYFIRLKMIRRVELNTEKKFGISRTNIFGSKKFRFFTIPGPAPFFRWLYLENY